MSVHDHANATTTSLTLSSELAQQLECNLRGQLECYDRLLVCLGRKREALRAASLDAIRDCCDQERSLAAVIRELEVKRQDLIRPHISAARGRQSTPLTEMASRCACADDRDRLLGLAADLRARLNVIRRESSIIRAAADALARHVAGILQTVTGTFTGARVYSSRGRMNIGASTQLTVDLKS